MTVSRILLVDEQPIVLNGLSQQLQSVPGFEVIGALTHSDRAFFEIVQNQPDLVILDLELPGRGAVDLASQVASRFPAIHLIFFTSYDTDIFIDLALRIGAAGYLLKSEPVESIVEAIELIAGGQRVYSGRIQERMEWDSGLQQYQVKSQSLLSELTLRQIEVLRHLARGETVKEVARTMRVSERAIESQKYRIMQRLCIHDRVQLTRFAIREGLMPP